MTQPLTETKLNMIEELGVLYEQSGLSPACARILALLLVSDTTELTFEEIYETLQMSKSAVSNALNYLLSTDRIEYLTRPGERKRYFRCKIQGLQSAVEKHLSGMDTFNSLLKKVVEQRPAETVEFNKSLLEVIDLLDFMKQELPLLFEKWKARKN
ncbi:MarR family transcriptional regulator [Paraflavisolibacter sp. H34]|uniref:GbsR/MarR family transcriptional regulator n=1 Tax=Huijunlia imazamoxiresistens TaxID=3127457 RepID=UPI0030170FE6